MLAGQLGRRHHALLAMVHAPEAMELGEVHVGLDAAVLARRERVGGPGAEEAAVGAGAAALGVRVGGLQGQRRALAAGMRGGSVWDGWVKGALAPGWGQSSPCLTRPLGHRNLWQR